MKIKFLKKFELPCEKPPSARRSGDAAASFFPHYRQNLGHLTHVLIPSKLFGAINNKADKLGESELERILVFAGGVVELLPHPGGEFECSCKSELMIEAHLAIYLSCPC